MTDHTTPEQGTAVRVGVYARTAYDGDGDGLAVRRQVAEGERFAAEKGWDVVETYVDNGISAKYPSRPAFERMLSDIRAGRLDAIIASDLDRLTRRSVELMDLLDLCERHGVKHLATVRGDAATAFIKGVAADEEVQKILQRVRLIVAGQGRL